MLLGFVLLGYMGLPLVVLQFTLTGILPHLSSKIYGFWNTLSVLVLSSTNQTLFHDTFNKNIKVYNQRSLKPPTTITYPTVLSLWWRDVSVKCSHWLKKRNLATPYRHLACKQDGVIASVKRSCEIQARDNSDTTKVNNVPHCICCQHLQPNLF